MPEGTDPVSETVVPAVVEVVVVEVGAVVDVVVEVGVVVDVVVDSELWFR